MNANWSPYFPKNIYRIASSGWARFLIVVWNTHISYLLHLLIAFFDSIPNPGLPPLLRIRNYCNFVLRGVQKRSKNAIARYEFSNFAVLTVAGMLQSFRKALNPCSSVLRSGKVQIRSEMNERCKARKTGFGQCSALLQIGFGNGQGLS